MRRILLYMALMMGAVAGCAEGGGDQPEADPVEICEEAYDCVMMKCDGLQGVGLRECSDQCAIDLGALDETGELGDGDPAEVGAAGASCELSEACESPAGWTCLDGLS